MPRDSNGVYSLPDGYTATTGETIQPSQHNPPLEDLAAAMSGSLPRNGAAPMTGPLKAAKGTLANPGLTFAGETGSGIYWKSASVLGIVINGAEVATINSNGVSVATAAIADDAVTFAKLQNIAHGKLVGRFTADAGNAEEVIIPLAQCRLAKSGSNIVLSPFRGNRITINSLIETIPDAGVSLAPSGLTPSTLYYIYAYMNSGTMTLEASTTADTVQAGTGIRVKNGDGSRTLVGMAYPITGPAFADTATQRFVRSLFNEAPVSLSNAFTTTRTTTSTTGVELNSEIRVEFLAWASEQLDMTFMGQCQSSANGGYCVNQIAIDGTAGGPTNRMQSIGSNAGDSTNVRRIATLTAGYHYATVFGNVDTGTGNWFVGGSSFFGTLG
jgi:hypothetical protein